ncbi:hypothetical protein PIB30_058885, partial [Stylosanthes scabra]|nr:hypothetical protein [Stylosanthes scabra]
THSIFSFICYAQNPTRVQSTRPIQLPHPTPENSKIEFLSSSLLYGDQRCNQMPHAITVSVAPAMIYYLILAALSWLHRRSPSLCYCGCTTVNTPPYPTHIAQNGGMPGFMAELRALTNY